MFQPAEILARDVPWIFELPIYGRSCFKCGHLVCEMFQLTEQ